jgi:YD repeat-containing protein
MMIATRIYYASKPLSALPDHVINPDPVDAMIELGFRLSPKQSSNSHTKVFVPKKSSNLVEESTGHESTCCFIRVVVHSSHQYKLWSCSRDKKGAAMKNAFLAILAFPLLVGTTLHAAETISYTYDAKGRLTKVVRTGTVNNNIQAQYTHDKANNRKNVTVTGSPNLPPP